MGGAMLLLGVKAQRLEIKPYHVGDRVPDVMLYHLFNYSADSAKLSSFGHKLIILDFWGIHCGSCIKALPDENALQEKFKDKVQFIMVSADDKDALSVFLEKYNKTNRKLTIPMVTSDNLIRNMFWYRTVPHFIWISPGGRIIAQTAADMLNKASIETALNAIDQSERHIRGLMNSEDALRYLVPKPAQKTFFEENKY